MLSGQKSPIARFRLNRLKSVQRTLFYIPKDWRKLSFKPSYTRRRKDMGKVIFHWACDCSRDLT